MDIAYKGTNYHGWQVQPNAITVQEVLNKVLSTLLREEIQTTGSGRTDAGVHAEQQVVHFDVSNALDEARMVYKINAMLPNDIACNKLYKVDDALHARYDAVSRAYEYRIKTIRDPFTLETTYQCPYELNVKRMNEAAALLLKAEDFETFSKAHGASDHFLCDIRVAAWKEEAENLTFCIQANRFLRGMVRAIVGTLLDVGRGKLMVKDFEEKLLAKDRSKASGAAPAKGLFLYEVKYK